MITRLALTCFAAALFSDSVCGQSARDWASLAHTPAISAGTEIEARTTDNKSYRGQFKAADDDALVMTTGSGEQRLARATVSRVSVKKLGGEMPVFGQQIRFARQPQAHRESRSLESFGSANRGQFEPSLRRGRVKLTQRAESGREKLPITRAELTVWGIRPGSVRVIPALFFALFSVIFAPDRFVLG
jgi:hypothetical protein